MNDFRFVLHHFWKRRLTPEDRFPVINFLNVASVSSFRGLGGITEFESLSGSI